MRCDSGRAGAAVIGIARYHWCVRETSRGDILAIDIGATSIKMADVTYAGEMVGSLRRRATPYPCTPDRLVSWIVERIATRGIPRVGIGFPGDFRDGVVRAPGNLSRRTGGGSEVDPAIDQAWRGFPLTEVLCRESGADVRIVNDAHLAALGSCEGVGTELVVSLGTGFGVALARDGAFVEIEDFGKQLIDGSMTFDDALGERARVQSEQQWAGQVRRAVADLADRWAVDVVHLSGGNAQRLRASDLTRSGLRVVIQGNRVALRGAARLFPSSG